MSPTSTPSTTVDLMSTAAVETDSLDSLAVAPERAAEIAAGLAPEGGGEPATAAEIPLPASSVLAP